MIAKDRLYLDSARAKIVLAVDRGPKTLLVGEGGEVPSQYEAMVKAFYAKPSVPETKTADPVNHLTTRDDTGPNQDESLSQISKTKQKKRGRHPKFGP